MAPYELLCTLAVVHLLVCYPLGMYVGEQHNAPVFGGVMGLLFGPIGLIIAALVDFRRLCRRCGTRLNGEPQICPGCGCDSPAMRKTTKQAIEDGLNLASPRSPPPRSPPGSGQRR